MVHLFQKSKNGICGGTVLKGAMPSQCTARLFPLMVFISATMLDCSTCVFGAGTTRHRQYRAAFLGDENNFSDTGLDDPSSANMEKGLHEQTHDISETSTSSVIVMSSKENTDCPPSTSAHCVRCNQKGCIKCPLYLVTDTRECVIHCPSGYIDQWSAHTEFMGRICIATGYSGAVMATLAGVLGGFLVCVSLLTMAVMLVRRRRRRKTIKKKLMNESAMDRSDFLFQLNGMRPNAQYFLAMLNDTRRQIRKLYLSGELAAANSYRPIVRDLAKILILLNRPIELIPAPPHDWNRLYTWSQRALERYKPQVGQLIDFLQMPPSSQSTAGGMLIDDSMEVITSAFYQKAGSGGGSSSSARGSLLQAHGSNNQPGNTIPTSDAQNQHLFGSLISLHEFEEPRSSDPFGSSFNTLKGGVAKSNLISDLNSSSLWLEDEFYKLGFRPQDEITTEL